MAPCFGVNEVQQVKTKSLMKIISSGESITVEFKESKKKINKDAYDSVCAFLNRHGGHLFLGVKDNGDIVGVDKESVDQLKKDFVTGIAPESPYRACPASVVG